MEKTYGNEKPAWMLYFDGEFYDNYLNNLRKLNLLRVNNYNINKTEKPDVKTEFNVLQQDPRVVSGNLYLTDGPKKIPEETEAEVKWRKRRTNGFVIIGILLIAALATATALIIHLVFIEGKDPFATTNTHESTVKNILETSTILSRVTSSRNQDKDRDLDVSTRPANSTFIAGSTKNTPKTTVDVIATTVADGNTTAGPIKNQQAYSSTTTLSDLTTENESKSPQDTTEAIDERTESVIISQVSRPTTKAPIMPKTSNVLTTKISITDDSRQTTKQIVESTTKLSTDTIKMQNTVTTVKPKKVGRDNDFGLHFIVLDKAGTTMDLDTGDVIEADKSRHTINDTNVILTGSVHGTVAEDNVKELPVTSDDPDIHCKHNPTSLMFDPTNCARYYNCSDPSVKQGLDIPYLSQCKYPLLFNDTDTGCTFFIGAVCGGRYEPKAPCEYVENKCFGNNCKPCEEISPSCVGRNNDTYEHSSGAYGTTYIVCFRERTVGQFTCKSGNYDKLAKKCIDKITWT